MKCVFANKLQLLATPPKSVKGFTSAAKITYHPTLQRNMGQPFICRCVNPTLSSSVNHGKMRVNFNHHFSSDESNPSSLEI